MLHLLGQPHHDGNPIPLERTTLLVAMLACAEGWQNRESLMALLWADAPLEAAQTRLRQLVYRASKFACFAGLESDRKRLRFVAPTDVALFRHALQHKRWLEATQVYGGRLLEGYIPPDEPELQDWLVQQRHTLEQDHINALLCASQELPSEQGFGLLYIAIQNLPLEERLLQRLLELGAVNPEAAQGAWQHHLSALEALGESPNPELQALLDELPNRNRFQAGLPVVEALIGRHAELEQLGKLWQQGARLVTLLGLGGMGKTHLAIEAANHESEAHFVSLVPIQHPQAVAGAILETFGITAQDPNQHVLKFLGNKAGLLVLDNFEHLLPAADLVASVLSAAPRLRVLVTSRERLGLQQEHLLELHGLPNPDDVFPLEVQDSAALFVRAAKRLEVGFELTNTDLPNFVQIHQLVSGSPLGLHLAASWVRVLSLEQIADELTQSLGLLTTQAADVPVRHRSLEAVFASSWERLSVPEQRIVARLSLLRGRFDAELGRLVGAASLPEFLGLVNKSLISKQQGFFLHEAVRQFAIKYLTPPEQEAVYSSLLERFLEFAERVVWGMKGQHEPQFLAQLSRELESLRVCLDWAVEHQPAKAAKIVCCLLYYLMASAFADTERWLGQLEQHDLPDWRHWLAWGRAYAHNRQTNLKRSTELALTALDSQDPLLLMLVNHLLASNTSEQVTYETSLCFEQAALEYAQRLGHPFEIDLLTEMGITETWANLLENAKLHFDQALAAATKHQSQYGRASALFGYSCLCAKLGELEQERTLLLEAQSWYTQSHDLKNRGYCALYLGSNAARLGLNQQANQHLLEAQDLFEDFGTTHHLMYLLSDYAQIAYNLGNFEHSAVLIYASIHLLEQNHAAYDWHFQADWLEPHLNSETRERLKRHAQTLSLAQALKFAKDSSQKVLV